MRGNSTIGHICQIEIRIQLLWKYVRLWQVTIKCSGLVMVQSHLWFTQLAIAWTTVWTISCNVILIVGSIASVNAPAWCITTYYRLYSMFSSPNRNSWVNRKCDWTFKDRFYSAMKDMAYNNNGTVKGLFTHTINITVFVSGTFDPFWRSRVNSTTGLHWTHC